MTNQVQVPDWWERSHWEPPPDIRGIAIGLYADAAESLCKKALSGEAITRQEDGDVRELLWAALRSCEVQDDPEVARELVRSYARRVREIRQTPS